MSRVTDHTRTEKIGGDSIFMFVVIQVVAGNRYDRNISRQLDLNLLLRDSNHLV